MLRTKQERQGERKQVGKEIIDYSDDGYTKLSLILINISIKVVDY